MADDVVLNIRTSGGRRAAAETREVSTAIRGISGAARVASGGLSNLRQSMNLGATASYALRRGVYVAGIAVAGAGTLAAKTGLQFNAFQEQSQVAFTQLIGSAAGARRELVWLQKTAAATPFELNQITDADRQLLAFNFSLKQTHGWLNTIGDVAAGSGKGPEAIERIVTAIGQIRSKGRLQGDELLQLSELGVVNRGRLAKDLGVTAAGVDERQRAISAPAARCARLQHQFNDTFGGQSAKQARTFNGQLSTLHDNINMTLGSDHVPRLHLPARQGLPGPQRQHPETSTRSSQRKDIDLSEKMTLSRAVLRRRLGPLENEIETGIRRLHLGDKISHEFEVAMPMALNAAAKAAPRAAGAFVSAWWHAGIWAKLFTIGLLSKKMGVFGALGDIAAQRFAARFAAGSAAEAAGGAAAGAGGGRALRALGAVGKYALPVGAGLGIAAGIDELGLNPFNRPGAKRGHQTKAEMDAAWKRAQADAARRGYVAAAPAAGRGKPTVAIVHLNGREIARAVAQEASNAHARTGR
jgi:tape measure domain-containing protein